jgi:non-ribosomal peptide synthetase component F
MGVEDEIIVPLCFEKSMWTTVATLGILKAGAAFVMLDPTLRELRLGEIVQQVDANVIISSTLNKELVSRLGNQTVTLDWSFFDATEVLSDDLINWKRARPSSLLYVVFTSGGAGTPKGAMITHKRLSSALHHQILIHS